MARSALTLSALLLAIVLAAPHAQAFTQEPVPGTEGLGGSRLADPQADERRPLDRRGDEEGKQRSPFSFSITGPGERSGPNVNRPGDDNRHLYWNNTSNRHDIFDRDSLWREQQRRR